MNPIVEEYLEKNANRVEQVAQEKEKAYRERVAKAAGLRWLPAGPRCVSLSTD